MLVDSISFQFSNDGQRIDRVLYRRDEMHEYYYPNIEVPEDLVRVIMRHKADLDRHHDF